MDIHHNDNIYIAGMLIMYGANIKIKNNDGENAYYIARKRNHINVCVLLLELIN